MVDDSAMLIFNSHLLFAGILFEFPVCLAHSGQQSMSFKWTNSFTTMGNVSHTLALELALMAYVTSCPNTCTLEDLEAHQLSARLHWATLISLTISQK